VAAMLLLYHRSPLSWYHLGEQHSPQKHLAERHCPHFASTTPVVTSCSIVCI